jgi:hypothetical protein
MTGMEMRHLGWRSSIAWLVRDNRHISNASLVETLLQSL